MYGQPTIEMLVCGRRSCLQCLHENFQNFEKSDKCVKTYQPMTFDESSSNWVILPDFENYRQMGSSRVILQNSLKWGHLA